MANPSPSPSPLRSPSPLPEGLTEISSPSFPSFPSSPHTHSQDSLPSLDVNTLYSWLGLSPASAHRRGKENSPHSPSISLPRSMRAVRAREGRALAQMAPDSPSHPESSSASKIPRSTRKPTNPPRTGPNPPPSSYSYTLRTPQKSSTPRSSRFRPRPRHKQPHHEQPLCPETSFISTSQGSTLSRSGRRSSAEISAWAASGVFPQPEGSTTPSDGAGGGGGQGSGEPALGLEGGGGWEKAVTREILELSFSRMDRSSLAVSVRSKARPKEPESRASASAGRSSPKWTALDRRGTYWHKRGHGESDSGQAEAEAEAEGEGEGEGRPRLAPDTPSRPRWADFLFPSPAPAPPPPPLTPLALTLTPLTPLIPHHAPPAEHPPSDPGSDGVSPTPAPPVHRGITPAGQLTLHPPKAKARAVSGPAVFGGRPTVRLVLAPSRPGHGHGHGHGRGSSDSRYEEGNGAVGVDGEGKGKGKGKGKGRSASAPLSAPLAPAQPWTEGRAGRPEGQSRKSWSSRTRSTSTPSLWETSILEEGEWDTQLEGRGRGRGKRERNGLQGRELGFCEMGSLAFPRLTEEQQELDQELELEYEHEHERGWERLPRRVSLKDVILPRPVVVLLEPATSASASAGRAPATATATVTGTDGKRRSGSGSLFSLKPEKLDRMSLGGERVRSRRLMKNSAGAGRSGSSKIKNRSKRERAKGWVLGARGPEFEKIDHSRVCTSSSAAAAAAVGECVSPEVSQGPESERKELENPGRSGETVPVTALDGQDELEDSEGRIRKWLFFIGFVFFPACPCNVRKRMRSSFDFRTPSPAPVPPSPLPSDHPLSLELQSLRTALTQYQTAAHNSAIHLQHLSLSASSAKERNKQLTALTLRLQEELALLREKPAETNVHDREFTLVVRRLSARVEEVERALEARVRRALELEDKLSVLGLEERERRVKEERRALERLARDVVDRAGRAASLPTPVSAGGDITGPSSSHSLSSSPGQYTHSDLRCSLLKLLSESSSHTSSLERRLSDALSQLEAKEQELAETKEELDRGRERAAQAEGKWEAAKADDRAAAGLVERYMRFSQSTTDSLRSTISTLQSRHSSTVQTLQLQLSQSQTSLARSERQVLALRSALDDVTQDVVVHSEGRRREVGLRLKLVGREERWVGAVRRAVGRAGRELAQGKGKGKGKGKERAEGGEGEVLQRLLLALREVLDEVDGPCSSPSPSNADANPTQPEGKPYKRAAQAVHMGTGALGRIVAAEQAVSGLVLELERETGRRMGLERERGFGLWEEGRGGEEVDGQLLGQLQQGQGQQGQEEEREHAHEREEQEVPEPEADEADEADEQTRLLQEPSTPLSVPPATEAVVEDAGYAPEGHQSEREMNGHALAAGDAELPERTEKDGRVGPVCGSGSEREYKWGVRDVGNGHPEAAVGLEDSRPVDTPGRESSALPNGDMNGQPKVDTEPEVSKSVNASGAKVNGYLEHVAVPQKDRKSAVLPDGGMNGPPDAAVGSEESSESIHVVGGKLNGHAEAASGQEETTDLSAVSVNLNGSAEPFKVADAESKPFIEEPGSEQVPQSTPAAATAAIAISPDAQADINPQVAELSDSSSVETLALSEWAPSTRSLPTLSNESLISETPTAVSSGALNEFVSEKVASAVPEEIVDVPAPVMIVADQKAAIEAPQEPVQIPEPPAIRFEEPAPAKPIEEAAKSPEEAHSDELLRQLSEASARYESIQQAFKGCHNTLLALRNELLSPASPGPVAEQAHLLSTAVNRLDDITEDTRVSLEIRAIDDARLAKGFETLLMMNTHSAPGTQLYEQIEAFLAGEDATGSNVQHTFEQKLDDLEHDISIIKRAVHEWMTGDTLTAGLSDEPPHAPDPTRPAPSPWGWTSAFLPSRPNSPSPTFGAVMSGAVSGKPRSPSNNSTGIRFPMLAPLSPREHPLAYLRLRHSMPSPSLTSPAPISPSFAAYTVLSPPGSASSVVLGLPYERRRTTSAYMAGLAPGLGMRAPPPGRRLPARAASTPQLVLSSDDVE
ncbi:hypothetical protein DACRYDRAFT_18102 [Dacryopinax primogenitus]|uniref:Uncharacterized protein n=1 Tax=Dacryopinax primogenitus (strain DJM 731) TaxID=1858805 RepID=M5G400_DACPD|nr:uncharacterized protein DACRYDRAFT_18102 [Dacryopinax primogenitus]EJT98487.1 hypothetical protein DACRYDRAFT_18102 [Dacryopinax primogenitus]